VAPSVRRAWKNATHPAASASQKATRRYSSTAAMACGVSMPAATSPVASAASTTPISPGVSRRPPTPVPATKASSSPVHGTTEPTAAIATARQRTSAIEPGTEKRAKLRLWESAD